MSMIENIRQKVRNDIGRGMLRRAVGLGLTWVAGAVVASEPTHAAAEGGSLAQEIMTNLNIDPQIVLVQAIGFLVMFWILWKALFRRVGGMLDRRRDEIASTLRKIEEDQAEAARLREETEARLAQIEREAQQRIQEATEQAQQQSAAILAEARENAEAEVERARERIARETDAAILELRAEVADLVVQATRQILNESLDEARQRRIVDDMIERLSARSASEGR